MAKVKQIQAHEILNGNGIPSIEVVVVLDTNRTAIASSPSGTSVGSYEAAELRDRDPNHFGGLGVQKAIDNINTIIAPKIVGIDVTHQQEIDKIMIDLDGTQNKSRLGANAILSVSMAIARAGAKSAVLPLFLYLRGLVSKEGTLHMPIPLFNLINGGLHAEDGLSFQEFLIVPATSFSYSQALEAGVGIDISLKTILKSNNLSTLTGMEGGFGPNLNSNADALSFLSQAVGNTGLRLGFDIFLGIDAAANSFFKTGQYRIKDKENSLSNKNLNEYYQTLMNEYHLLYLEDPLAEDDWDGWQDIVSKLAADALIVGDDLVATNPYRLQMAIDKRAINAVVIKPNQIGTVLEALAVAEVAKAAGLKLVVAHRSGETNDDFIADFAVAVSADYVKFGAPIHGEHVAKYNRLLRIENQLKIL